MSFFYQNIYNNVSFIKKNFGNATFEEGVVKYVVLWSRHLKEQLQWNHFSKKGLQRVTCLWPLLRPLVPPPNRRFYPGKWYATFGMVCKFCLREARVDKVTLVKSLFEKLTLGGGGSLFPLARTTIFVYTRVETTTPPSKVTFLKFFNKSDILVHILTKSDILIFFSLLSSLSYEDD